MKGSELFYFHFDKMLLFLLDPCLPPGLEPPGTSDCLSLPQELCSKFVCMCVFWQMHSFIKFLKDIYIPQNLKTLV